MPTSSMTPSPASGQSAALTARIIHAALISGIVMFVVVATFVREPVTPNDAIASLGRVIPVLAIVAFGAVVFLARRLPRRPSTQSREDWWGANQPGAIVIWALLESVGLLGSVTYFMSGSSYHLIWVGLSLLMFIFYSPGRLSENS